MSMQILAAGDAAVEPLREVLKTRPLGWPAEAPIVHAAGILSMMRPPSALPDFIAAARFYKETGKVAADAIARYGPEGFDTLLELIGDPSITGYHQSYFIDSAKIAAGDDPVKRARLAEILRQVFTRVVGELKETLALERQLLNSENEEEDDAELAEILGKTVEDPATEEATQPGDDEELEAIRQMDADNETGTYEALSLLASDLCDLADPLARDMLQSAFDEDLIDESIIDRKTAWQIYDEGGETFGPNTPWFQEYSESYLEEQSDRERLARTPQVQFPSRTSYPSFSPGRKEAPPAPIQPIEPFRYTAPKIGRNDPCWCGSGKKYKRCHLGKDAPG